MKDLEKASTPVAQARALGRFSDAYRAAALRVPTLRAPVAARPANASIRSALADTSDGFGRLQSSARRLDRVGYKAARRALGRSEARVRAALHRLDRLGYQPRTPS
jgi:hypothetical protein